MTEDAPHRILVADDVPFAADAVWGIIGDFHGIRKWALVVADETPEITSEGEFRIISMGDGRQVREQLVARDEHSYTYTLPRPDLRSYLSTIRVVPLASGQSRIELEILFEVDDGVDVAPIEARLGKFCGQNLKAMKAALASAA